MKTLKWIGIILFLCLSGNYLYNDDVGEPQAVLQEYTQEDETISKYGKPAEEPKRIAPETVYVEKPASPEPKVEIVYYDPDNPDVLYSADQVHQVQWLFPTGPSRKAFPPGSQLEREWIEHENNKAKKRYKPDYVIEPVETGQ